MKRKIKDFLEWAVYKLFTSTLRSASFHRQNQVLLSLKYREIAARGERLNFDDIGFNVFTVTNEDGVFHYIFSTIGFTNRKCVDIGAGAVKGSSVANLIVHQGFKALLVDGDTQSLENARRYYSGKMDNFILQPEIVCSMVTAENINQILESNKFTGELDLLCLDIDGVDYWIWKAIQVVQPRLVMVEFQDLLGADRAWTIPYNPKFYARDYPVNKDINNYCGASLQAFVNLGREKGYRLIGVNKSGWNAFFMRNGIGEGIFPERTARECFGTEWNKYSAENRFPLVKDMPWEEV